MSDSLQDQLVKAGLADPKQARKRGGNGRGKGKAKGKPGGNKRAGGGKGRRRGGGGAASGDGGAGMSGAKAPKPQSARERSARLRQIVAAARLSRTDADTPYRFTSGRRVKEITVTAAQQGQLARGEAGIVNVEGHFDVVPAATIEQVRELDEKAVVLLNTPGNDTDAGDDPYADRPVPDDLTW